MLQIGSILFEDLAYDHIDKVEYFSRLVDWWNFHQFLFSDYFFVTAYYVTFLQSCSTTEKAQGQGKQSHEYGRYGDEVMDDDLARSWIFLIGVSVQGI